MERIRTRHRRRGGWGTDFGRSRRLRPTVTVLEGRTLLSTLTVTNADDSGAGSLRAAVAQANTDGGGDTIVFSSLFDSPQTITLTGGQLELSGTTGTTTITGPGANLLSVSGNKPSRVFLIDQGVTASVSGLTITGGNTAYEGGGLENAGELKLTDCTVSGNSAGAGGGLFNTGGGTTTLTHCTFSDNSAVSSGGGLLNYGGTLSLTD